MPPEEPDNETVIPFGQIEINYRVTSIPEDVVKSVIPLITIIGGVILFIEICSRIMHRKTRYKKAELPNKPDKSLLQTNQIVDPSWTKVLSFIWLRFPSPILLGGNALFISMVSDITIVPNHVGVTSNEFITQFTYIFTLAFIISNVMLVTSIVPLEFEEVSYEWTYPIKRMKLWSVYSFIIGIACLILYISWSVVVFYYRYHILLTVPVNFDELFTLTVFILLLALIQAVIILCTFFFLKDKMQGMLFGSLFLIIINQWMPGSYAPTFSSISSSITENSNHLILFLVMNISLLVFTLASSYLFKRIDVKN
jgi:hypothetical protein